MNGHHQPGPDSSSIPRPLHPRDLRTNSLPSGPPHPPQKGNSHMPCLVPFYRLLLSPPKGSLFKSLDNTLNKPKSLNPLLAETFPLVFRQPSRYHGGIAHDRNNNSKKKHNASPGLIFTTFDMVQRPYKLSAYIRP
ncbi:hypothetical protein N7475_004637 [Penicillium sp. IBT 31633x]|nr:hypothetical protein N7475_004637 [Penicillium sp. IBT 31633x]